MSARDVFIELKERCPSARIARAQEPGFLSSGARKWRRPPALQPGSLSHACRADQSSSRVQVHSWANQALTSEAMKDQTNFPYEHLYSGLLEEEVASDGGIILRPKANQPPEVWRATW